MEQLTLFDWWCPECGCLEMWFDRSMTGHLDENGDFVLEEDMCDRCCNCGQRVSARTQGGPCEP